MLDFSTLDNFAFCRINYTRIFCSRLFTFKEHNLQTNYTKVLSTYNNFTRLILLDFSNVDNFARCYINHTRLFHFRLFTLKEYDLPTNHTRVLSTCWCKYNDNRNNTKRN